MADSKEIRSLTGLRGLASVYVVVFHFRSGRIAPTLGGTFLEHGYLAVDSFFILSGFVMALNYQHMFERGWTAAMHLKFLGRRIARIYPLYLVCTVLALLLMLAGEMQRLPHCNSLGRALWVNLVLAQSLKVAGCGSLDPPAWSISTEWVAYLLFPALLVPTLPRRPRWAWISGCLSVAVLALLCFVPASFRNGLSAVWMIDYHSSVSPGLALVRCITEFMLGLLCFRIAESRAGMAARASAWLAPALCCSMLLLLMLRRTDLAFVLLCAALIVCLSSEGGEQNAAGRLLSSRPAEMLGVLSYGIYLLHELCIGMHYSTQRKLMAMGVPHAVTLSGAAWITVLLATAYGMHRTIEVPGRQWLRNVFERRNTVVVLQDAIVPSGEFD